MTLLERFQKALDERVDLAVNVPCSIEDMEHLRRDLAIAQAVKELRELKPVGVSGIMRRADELLRGG